MPHSLAHGNFFGVTELHREVPGFSISVLRAKLRAEDVPLHTHRQASFVFVLAGAYRSGADGARPVEHGPALIFNPAGTTHRDSFEAPSGSFLALSVSAAFDSDASAARMIKGRPAIGSAQSLTRLCAREASACEIESACWDLVSYAADAPPRKSADLPPWTRLAREVLRDRSHGPLHIRDVATELGIDAVHFARMFRRAFGCTPGEYLVRCRLERAMSLLRADSPECSLAEIALACGFFDQSHFTKTFKHHFGIPPSAYLRQLRS